ncbi:trehalase family glycosidase [Clostridium taeniosporum]|uniref:Alpha,alpha-trehalase n=1 Tax=Clostridium taeniosporum TaxID=394958 RepID=A0A1D7XJ71_9CLOT|nr:trehalase family glycosidase [Clostridium taeniosporum]AOR23384.1 alpha,alpha-trehalase [Clostridium taeniosporum]
MLYLSVNENKNIRFTLEYIHNYWDVLIKKSPKYTQNQLFYLPNYYVVPGGVFNQLFYWDSYFIILGLKNSKSNAFIKGIVENFLYEMKTFGIIPNSSEIAHLSRSQPPFLTSMIEEVWNNDKTWLKKAYEITKIEYKQVWMNPKTHYNEDIGLNKYCDDLEKMLKINNEAYLHYNDINIPDEFLNERTEAESGWDYTARFNNKCKDFIPVDLNSLLYKYEVDLYEFSKVLNLNSDAINWKQKALKRKKLMDKYLWNNDYGVYFDFNYIDNKQNLYYSLATFYPLWAGIASSYQSNRIAKSIPLFLHKGGMVTSLTKSGHQWDYPNGWAPLQWIVIKGLKNYGFEKESIEIALRWIHLCTEMFIKHGKLYEKYNVVDLNIETSGRYKLQDGFGWTNGVYEKIISDIFI